jgi:hypothetical protein
VFVNTSSAGNQYLLGTILEIRGNCDKYLNIPNDNPHPDKKKIYGLARSHEQEATLVKIRWFYSVADARLEIPRKISALLVYLIITGFPLVNSVLLYSDEIFDILSGPGQSYELVDSDIEQIIDSKTIQGMLPHRYLSSAYASS